MVCKVFSREILLDLIENCLPAILTIDWFLPKRGSRRSPEGIPRLLLRLYRNINTPCTGGEAARAVWIEHNTSINTIDKNQSLTSSIVEQIVDIVIHPLSTVRASQSVCLLLMLYRKLD